MLDDETCDVNRVSNRQMLRVALRHPAFRVTFYTKLAYEVLQVDSSIAAKDGRSDIDVFDVFRDIAAEKFLGTSLPAAWMAVEDFPAWGEEVSIETGIG